MIIRGINHKGDGSLRKWTDELSNIGEESRAGDQDQDKNLSGPLRASMRRARTPAELGRNFL